MVLNEATLVLNRHWLPVDVTTVCRALAKVYEGAARVVHPADYSVHDFDSWASLAVAEGAPCVRTATLSLPLPEVIVLARYAGQPDRRVAFSRRNLFKRDRYTCQYCGKRPGTEELTIDHVLPRARGGVSSWTNCVLACLPCNARKGDKTLREAALTLRCAPVEPTWAPRLVVARWPRKASWAKFVSDAYWNVELEA